VLSSDFQYNEKFNNGTWKNVFVDLHNWINYAEDLNWKNVKLDLYGNKIYRRESECAILPILYYRRTVCYKIQFSIIRCRFIAVASTPLPFKELDSLPNWNVYDTSGAKEESEREVRDSEEVFRYGVEPLPVPEKHPLGDLGPGVCWKWW